MSKETVANFQQVLTYAHWAAEECERQRVGPLRVADMLEATACVIGPSFILRAEDIMLLGYLVEPGKNPLHQWRNVAVTIGGHTALMKHELIPRAMRNLIKAWPTLDADAWYREFEEIHPFVDGNGRVGSILWNLHNGYLVNNCPSVPPDYWSGTNDAAAIDRIRSAHHAELAYTIEDLSALWDEGTPAELVKTPWRVRFRLATRILRFGRTF